MSLSTGKDISEVKTQDDHFRLILNIWIDHWKMHGYFWNLYRTIYIKKNTIIYANNNKGTAKNLISEKKIFL